MAPPIYPTTAARAGVTGTVYLVLRVARDGSVEEVVTEQVNLRLIADDHEMTHWRRVLSQAATNTARRWTFTPPTAGDEVDAEFWSVRVPVDFVMTERAPRAAAYGQWETYVPGPKVPAPWIEHDQNDIASSDAFAGGGVYHVGAGLRLLTPLGGR